MKDWEENEMSGFRLVGAILIVFCLVISVVLLGGVGVVSFIRGIG